MDRAPETDGGQAGQTGQCPKPAHCYELARPLYSESGASLSACYSSLFVPWPRGQGLGTKVGLPRTLPRIAKLPDRDTHGDDLGISIVRARQVYTSVIRPAAAYTAAVWHQPEDIGRTHPETEQKRRNIISSELSKVQNSCLHRIAGAYRATPATSLETETQIPPLDLYLDERVAATAHRLEITGMGESIAQACTRVHRNLEGLPIKQPWEELIHPQSLRPAWFLDYAKPQNPGTKDERVRTQLRKLTVKRWKQRWARRKPPWGGRTGHPARG
jgi:hypothetical protein